MDDDELCRITRTAMSHILYSDVAMPSPLVALFVSNQPPCVPENRWRRIKGRIAMMCGRVRDAWAVLRGRAEIGDGW